MTNSWRLPDAPLRSSVVGTHVIALVTLVVVAWAVRGALHATAWYPLKAAAILSVVTLVSVGFVNAGHPYPHFGPANQLTTARAAIVALVAGLVGEAAAAATATCAAIASLVATVLDGLDGRFARVTGMASVFGARFDMEIDALLILALSVLVWQYDKAGAWVMAAGLLRYAFVAAGWVFPRMLKPLPPSTRRKTVCVIQIAGLGMIVSPIVPAPAATWMAAALLGILSYSFLADTAWLWRRVD